MAEPTGLAAIVADAVGDRGPIPPETEQLDLAGALGLPPPKRAARAPGRPPGAINRATERIASYLLAKYRDPLEGLVQMAGMGVDELASMLGCTAFEAWQEKRLCIAAALPYLHRRQPIAVDLTNHQLVHLTIGGGAARAVDGTAGVTLLEGLAEIVENQEVNDAPSAQV